MVVPGGEDMLISQSPKPVSIALYSKDVTTLRVSRGVCLSWIIQDKYPGHYMQPHVHFYKTEAETDAERKI